MITTNETRYSVANTDRPKWVPEEPEVFSGLLFLFIVLGAGIGAFIGIFTTIAVDGLWFNGAGYDGSAEMTGNQAFAWIAPQAVIGAIIAGVQAGVLPRLWKNTYFTTPEHRDAYLQFMSLTPESQEHARDAYNALAAFDDPEYSRSQDSEYALMQEAQSIWNRTYSIVKKRDTVGLPELHVDRLNDARTALKALEN